MKRARVIFSILFLLVCIVLLALYFGRNNIGVVHLKMWVRAQLPYTPKSVNIPTPVLPVPNAYDVYVKAGDRLVQSDAITQAYEDLQKGKLETADAVALVKKNSAALATLRRGFPLQYCHPPVRSVDTQFPQLARCRQLSRLLALEGHLYTVQGQWGNAAQSALDNIELGIDIPHGGPLIATLVGYVIQSQGRRELRRNLDHLDAAAAARATARLQQLLPEEVATTDILREEFYCGYASLQEKLLDEKEATGRAESRRRFNQIMIDEYVAYMQKSIENVGHPYVDQRQLPEPVGFAAAIMAPMDRKVAVKCENNTAQNRMLLIALALRQYRVEKGRYPGALKELTPSCLKTLPLDPFARNSTFRYRRQDDGYQLYSVGPDTIDDGGKAIEDKLSDESTGDIIFGNND